MYTLKGDVMDLSGVEMIGDRVIANLTPSAKNGVFVAKCGGELVVGDRISLQISNHSQGVIDGDAEALRDFIEPDPSTPGWHILKNCIASLHPDEWKSYGLDGKVAEYSPVEAPLQGWQGLDQAE